MLRASLSLLLLWVLAPVGARAEGLAFVHSATIYLDAKEVALKAPEAVACTDNGYVVVGDTGNKRLLTYSFKNGVVSGGAEIKLAQLTAPVRLQVDSKGNVLALDGKSRRIVKVAADGSFGGYVDPKGVESGGKPVLGAFKVDTSDRVWALDVAGRRVLQLDASGVFQGQVDLPKESGTVTDIAVDGGGTLYAIDAVGAVLWTAEKGGKVFRAVTSGMKDRMSFPIYMVARKGRLFVVDQYGSGLVVLGVDGSYQGRQLSIGWNEGLVNYPSQLCFAGDAIAFLADRFNNRVQAYTTGMQ